MSGTSTTPATRAERVTEYTLYPAGLTPGHPDERAYAVLIQWRGEPHRPGGGYGIFHGGAQLTHRQRWTWPRRPTSSHRWPDLDGALSAARAVVDDVTVHGLTWADREEDQENTG